MNSRPPALSIEGLAVTYDGQPVLWDVYLDVPPGVMMGVVGPNGAGKSTLLKAILGFVPRLAGRIEVLGRPAARQRKQIGYVPQRTTIDWDFPTSVMDLVLMGTYGRLGWIKRPGKKQKRQAMAALERVELQGLADRQIGELSGGQQQRAFLARAFVQDTPIYLMDEPFAGVDVPSEKALIRLMKEMRNEQKTLLVVHHELTTVPEYFDEVALLNCEIIECGPVAQAFNEEAIKRTYGLPATLPNAAPESAEPDDA